MSYADTILKLKTRGGKLRAFSAYKIVEVAETNDGATEIHYSVGDPKFGPLRSVVVREPFEEVYQRWIDGLQQFGGE